MSSNGAIRKYQCVAMACQGGGSLGAYHVGSLEAMQEAGYVPLAIAGISIGAFTAAIIAGNKPEKRVEKLKQFWDTISWPDFPVFGDILGTGRKLHNMFSTMQAVFGGQPSFFEPRYLSPLFQAVGTPEATSFYNTDVMYEMLPQFVNFKLINEDRPTRLVLGTTRVRDGVPVWFDNFEGTKIGPEHVMASGAMPPGFPGIRIDGDLYWDGGCYSNTPLEGLYDRLRTQNTLCFVINLFGPSGREPQDIAEVSLTIKEIQFSNRISSRIESIRKRHNLARLLRCMSRKCPEALVNNPQRAEIEELMADTIFDFIQVQYQKPGYEVQSCDCEFSKSSIACRMRQGHLDMTRAIEEWQKRIDERRVAREMASVGCVEDTFARGELVKTSFHPARVLAAMTTERGEPPASSPSRGKAYRGKTSKSRNGRGLIPKG